MKYDTHNNQQLYQCQGWPEIPCKAIYCADNVPTTIVEDNKEMFCRCCNSRNLKLIEEK